MEVESSSIPMTDVLVLGEGPIPAEGMLIGQGPGWEEVALFTELNQTPRPFVGPAGQEMDEYLRQANVARTSLFITNAYKQFLIGNRRPTIEELADHREMLIEEILIVQPRVIGGAGDCASEWLSRLAGQPFRDLESEHGIPRWITIAGHKCILVPLYHPAAGLYNPEAMGGIWYDFQVFGKVLRGELVPKDLPAITPLSGTLITSNSLRLVFGDAALDIAIDTEGDKTIPWGLTFSLDGLFGWKIGVEHPELLAEFNQLIHDHNLTIILQNSPHDIPVLRALGVEVCDLPIIDTMILAYLLCVEPQGLKALGWRWMKVAMKEYRELADPTTEKKAREYLERVVKVDWDACPECGAKGKLGVKHYRCGYPINHSIIPLGTQVEGHDYFTPKGNIKKKFLPYVNWCPGGNKDYSIAPLNKRIRKMLEPLVPPALLYDEPPILMSPQPVDLSYQDDKELPF